MKKFGILFSVVLLVSSCVSKVPSNSIRIYDENAYIVAKPLLLADLNKQNIETEISPSSSSVDLRLGVFGEKTAQNLYKKLSLSFRFRDAGTSEQSISLRDYSLNNAVITMDSYGFTIDLGLEFITVAILGETDWDRDNIKDFIVSFRIEHLPIKYELDDGNIHLELPSREYLLLIRDVHSKVYDADILLIHDYINQSNGIRSEVYKSYEEAQNGLFQDHAAMNFDQGQAQIVFAPNSSKKRNNNRQKMLLE